MKKCEKCGAIMFVNNNIVFTSNPPQYQLYCPDCGHTTFEYYENITLGDLGNHIACPECEDKDNQIAELKRQNGILRVNYMNCEVDRTNEQGKKNIAMKRVRELKKQLALTEKALELCERHHIGFENATHEAQVDWRETRIRENIAYFKQQAEKEMSDGIQSNV